MLIALVAAAVFLPKAISGSGSKDSERREGTSARTGTAGSGGERQASPPAAQGPGSSPADTPDVGGVVPPAQAAPGNRIVFTSLRDGNAEVYAVNDDLTDLANLTKHGAADRSPALSPDGTKIAFVSNRGGNEDIYVMNSNGGDVRRLTDSPASDITPSWSPDGTKIVFARKEGIASHIYVMNADGSGQRDLNRNLGSHPVWSPDGTKIAFASNSGEIAVVNALGGGELRLTNHQAVDAEPEWSSDGQLFFMTQREGPASPRIYSMKADGADQRRVTSGSSPAWSQRVSKLAFVRGGNIYVSAKGSEKAVTDKGQDSEPDW